MANVLKTIRSGEDYIESLEERSQSLGPSLEN